jgi:diacylglycerol kinase family enzyme
MNVAAVVYNKKSGSSLSKTELAKRFAANGIVVDTYITIGEGFEDVLKPCLKKDAIIIAIGGDGTISGTAGFVAGTEAVLAPLPGGTLNHFTKDLGIDQDIDKAIAHLPSAPRHDIDIARVNETYFINNSSIGLYPSSLQTRDRLEDRLVKWPSAVIGIIRAFVRYKTYTMTIGKTTFTTPFLFVGNNDYKIDQPGEGRTRLDQGVLSVCTIVAKNRWTILRLLPYALIGRLAEHDAFHVQTTESFTIQAKRSHLRVSHDGEHSKLEAPLTYEIKKKYLRILGV